MTTPRLHRIAWIPPKRFDRGGPRINYHHPERLLSDDDDVRAGL
ncbi:hypothetical protein [Mycobacterium paragordonae]|nr:MULTISPECIES: hypothetical protein [Mycobacterium]